MYSKNHQVNPASPVEGHSLARGPCVPGSPGTPKITRLRALARFQIIGILHIYFGSAPAGATSATEAAMPPTIRYSLISRGCRAGTRPRFAVQAPGGKAPSRRPSVRSLAVAGQEPGPALPFRLQEEKTRRAGRQYDLSRLPGKNPAPLCRSGSRKKRPTAPALSAILAVVGHVPASALPYRRRQSHLGKPFHCLHVILFHTPDCGCPRYSLGGCPRRGIRADPFSPAERCRRSGPPPGRLRGGLSAPAWGPVHLGAP